MQGATDDGSGGRHVEGPGKDAQPPQDRALAGRQTLDAPQQSVAQAPMPGAVAYLGAGHIQRSLDQRHQLGETARGGIPGEQLERERETVDAAGQLSEAGSVRVPDDQVRRVVAQPVLEEPNRRGHAGLGAGRVFGGAGQRSEEHPALPEHL